MVVASPCREAYDWFLSTGVILDLNTVYRLLKLYIVFITNDARDILLHIETINNLLKVF